MKVFIILFQLLSLNLFAENEYLTKCKSLSGFAQNVMKGRQAGVPMSKYMELSNKKPELKVIIEDITIDAYDRPRFMTDEMVQREIDDFTNKQYLKCIKAVRK